MGLRRTLRRRIFDLSPTLALSVWYFRALRTQARAHRAAAIEDRDPAELLTELGDPRKLAIDGHSLIDPRPGFGSMVAVQKRDELAALLRRLGELRPRRVCEIGTASGGTLYLWTRIADPSAVIVSLDLRNPPQALALRRRFTRPGQTLAGIEGDSKLPETRAAVELALGGEPLDFLFIDGDHSYEGVKADFEAYAPLVRPGGLIALHDINEDRRDHPDGGEPVSGEVPRLWAELKASRDTEELIADPAQHGFGIGLVHV